MKISYHCLYGVHVYVFTNDNSLQYVFTQTEHNLIQNKWLEFLKDYDMCILYHPGKPNVGADTLSMSSICSITHLEENKKELEKDVNSLACLGVRVMDST